MIRNNEGSSGSAPPTVKGSLSAVGGLFSSGAATAGGGGATPFSAFPEVKNVNVFASEEEFRSDPSYHSYYYSNVNFNPRLAPPLLSKEDWKYAHRLKGGNSGLIDKKKVNGTDNGSGRSLFSTPPGFDSGKQENEEEAENVHSSAEWGDDGLIGLSGIGFGSKQKECLGPSAPVTRIPSRPASCSAFEENFETVGSAESELAHLRHELTSSGTSRSSAYLSRSATPDPQLIARARSSCLTPIGGDRVDMVAALSGMNMSSNGVIDEDNQLPSQIEQDVENHRNYLFGLQDCRNHIKQKANLKSESGHLHMPSAKSNGGRSDLKTPSLLSDRQAELQKYALPSKYSYLKGSPASTLNGGGSLPAQYQYDVLSGYSLNPALASVMASQLGTGNLPPLFGSVASSAIRSWNGLQSAWRRQIIGNAVQAPFIDPMYLQYLMSSDYSVAQLAPLNDPSMDMGAKSGSSNIDGFYGSPTFGGGMSYPGSPLASPVIPSSPVGLGPLHFEAGCNVDESFSFSLLEEFKSNKLKCFELSEIAGHVIEFSADQYGSRFIQQKLETATTEEKNMVYEEIRPQALALMTDVFGNYVIQKFLSIGFLLREENLRASFLVMFQHLVFKCMGVGDPEGFSKWFLSV
ncbi:Pumilio 2 isoform 2 [Hibiscus syriacus]|uniref:Pumilio 2 isoform 2 n=1 Tax=Hibiscus syriacus TaxID=106335 RepID=A0A6A3D158_HIBSY|nr:Pumilio 2 isoform 2 [Hibiscus syriacus]